MKARSKKASGGEADFGKPRDDYKADAKDKPTNYGSSTNVSKETEEKKRGGRAKRKSGGGVKHLECGEDMKHAKHVGNVKGTRDATAARTPRKSGGRAGSNFSPMSSAHAGTPPREHRTTDID